MSTASERIARTLARAYELDAGRLTIRVERLVAKAQRDLGLEPSVVEKELDRWREMEFWAQDEPGARKRRFDTADDAITNLQRWLNVHPFLGWLRENALTLLTIVGVLAAAAASALFSKAYSRFYEDLGVSPHEFPLSSNDIGSQPLLAAVVFIAIASFWLALAALPTIALLPPLFDPSRTEKRLAPWTEWAVLGGLMVVAVIAVYGAEDGYPELFAAIYNPPPEIVVMLVVCVPSLVGIVHHLVTRQAPLVGFNDGIVIAALLLLPIGAVSMLSKGLDELAKDKANAVQAGHEAHPVKLEGVPLLDVRADRMRMTSAGDPVSGVPRTACVLYVAQGGGRILVQFEGKLLRIPEGQVALESESPPKKGVC